MSKLLQRGATVALRVRHMGSAGDIKQLSPEKLAEFGRKINPAQTNFGAKDKKLEKAQQFFQDPLNATKPIYRRGGPMDEFLVGCIGVVVGGIFVYNIGYFFMKT